MSESPFHINLSTDQIFQLVRQLSPEDVARIKEELRQFSHSEVAMVNNYHDLKRIVEGVGPYFEQKIASFTTTRFSESWYFKEMALSNGPFHEMICMSLGIQRGNDYSRDFQAGFSLRFHRPDPAQETSADKIYRVFAQALEKHPVLLDHSNQRIAWIFENEFIQAFYPVALFHTIGDITSFFFNLIDLVAEVLALSAEQEPLVGQLVRAAAPWTETVRAMNSRRMISFEKNLTAD